MVNVKKTSKSFESSLESAKDILEKLSSPEVSLEDSMKHYKSGLKHLSDANKILEKAKLEFQDISKSLSISDNE